jgi:hypothetical protein
MPVISGQEENYLCSLTQTLTHSLTHSFSSVTNTFSCIDTKCSFPVKYIHLNVYIVTRLVTVDRVLDCQLVLLDYSAHTLQHNTRLATALNKRLIVEC